MAEITLRLRHDPQTGVRELVIHYESEDDAMPHEHELDHRAWVEALLGRPIGEIADVVSVERISKGRVAADAEAADAGERAAVGVEEG